MGIAENTVHDTMVQLFAKFDSIEELNNIFVTDMIKRRDIINEDLLKTNRLEAQMTHSLPDEHGRHQILDIHISRMKEYTRIANDVDLEELATITKNFSDAELKDLVRVAQNTAMYRTIKYSSKIEVDLAAMDNLMITQGDFLHALEHDVKSAYGANVEILNKLLIHGIINWGRPVTKILADGNLCVQQARATEGFGIVSVLLEGPPNSGKTALAAQIAQKSGFFVKVFTPDDMIGFIESAKCLSMQKIFNDAYCSQLSCILIDNIERLLDYSPIGPKYSNLTLQALLLLLKRPPPPGRKLLILCTSSRSMQVLDNLGILSAFNTILHVPNLSNIDHLLNVLEEIDLFSKHEMAFLHAKLQEKCVFIGIKKLLYLIDMTRQMEPNYRVAKFLSKLEEEGGLK